MSGLVEAIEGLMAHAVDRTSRSGIPLVPVSALRVMLDQHVEQRSNGCTLTRAEARDLVGSDVVVEAVTRPGEVHSTGRVVAYSVEPTVLIERADGSTQSWRYDMVRPAAEQP